MANALKCPVCDTPCQALSSASEWPRFVADHLAALDLEAHGPALLSPLGGLMAHAVMVHDDIALALPASRGVNQ